MTKGEALQLLACTSQDDLGDNLIELAAAYWLEKGYSHDEILELMSLALDGDDGEETDYVDAED